jgi:hypothetical protein
VLHQLLCKEGAHHITMFFRLGSIFISNHISSKLYCRRRQKTGYRVDNFNCADIFIQYFHQSRHIYHQSSMAWQLSNSKLYQLGRKLMMMGSLHKSSGTSSPGTKLLGVVNTDRKNRWVLPTNDTPLIQISIEKNCNTKKKLYHLQYWVSTTVCIHIDYQLQQ